MRLVVVVMVNDAGDKQKTQEKRDEKKCILDIYMHRKKDGKDMNEKGSKIESGVEAGHGGYMELFLSLMLNTTTTTTYPRYARYRFSAFIFHS